VVSLEELPAYAAVALAGIGWLPDTLLSRSIVIRMRRRHAGEHVEGFRRRIHEVEGWRVRDQIAAWAKSAAGLIAWPELPPQIVDRDADVWEPLIAVADVIGGDWPARARQAGVVLVSESKEIEPSLGIRLLADLRTVFSTDEMSSKSILHALHAIEEAPWSELKGKPLDERGLAYRLRQYGIRPKTVRLGAATARGYTRTDMVDLWERYLLPLAATSNTSNTSDTSSGNVSLAHSERNEPRQNLLSKNNNVLDVSDVSPLGGEEGVCAHCHQGGGTFCVASIGGEPISLHVACKDHYRP
jgi:hypothetical protein